MGRLLNVIKAKCRKAKSCVKNSVTPVVPASQTSIAHCAMGVHSESLLALLGVIAFLGFASTVQGEMCYSKHSGFSSCSNGCCGSDDDQSCCTQVFLIVGLAVGATVIGTVVVVLLLCWVCKDCQHKICHCCGRRRRRREERGRRGRQERHHGRQHGHTRRVVVHPVQPPDYSTATQERAPSVQPGINHRHLPLSPPPPYTEILPSQSPNPRQQSSPRVHKTTAANAAPPASLFIVGPAARSVNGQAVCEDIARPSSDGNANGSGNELAITVPENGHRVPSVSPSGPDSTHSNATIVRGAFSHAATTRTPSRVDSTTPPETTLTSSSTNNSATVHSDYLIRVRESPRRVQGSDSVVGGGSSQQASFQGPEIVSGRSVLHTVRESVDEADQLDLV
ncbi:hypothetical protein ACOMHN_013000 [Nucella lapillus]